MINIGFPKPSMMCSISNHNSYIIITSELSDNPQAPCRLPVPVLNSQRKHTPGPMPTPNRCPGRTGIYPYVPQRKGPLGKYKTIEHIYIEKQLHSIKSSIIYTIKRCSKHVLNIISSSIGYSIRTWVIGKIVIIQSSLSKHVISQNVS